jgi:hypothetical protein
VVGGESLEDAEMAAEAAAAGTLPGEAGAPAHPQMAVFGGWDGGTGVFASLLLYDCGEAHTLLHTTAGHKRRMHCRCWQLV